MDPPEMEVAVEHPVATPLHTSSTVPYVSPVESDESERLVPAATSPGSRERAGVLARLTRVLRWITFDYPAFRWHRLGRVRLPEDEEATNAAANQELQPPSRFAGCWANIKKRQFRLQWWHYLLFLFVILSATIPPIVVAAVRHARRHSWTPPKRPVPEQVCYEPAEFTLRLDELHPRFGRQDYLYKATTSFDVRADVPQFAFAAQQSHGVVRLVLDNSTAGHGAIRNISVDVTAYLDDWHVFQRDMIVCRYSSWPHAATEIYSRDRYRYPPLRSAFEVTVRLPAGSDITPVDLHNILTTVTDMEVIVEDLADRVTFDSVHFSTQNAPVHVESLTARSSILVSAANAPVRGSFNAPSIHLINSNGEITVNASIATEPSRQSGQRARMRLFSSNRPITANVTLQGMDQAWIPSVPLDLQTSNAPITLNVSTGPGRAPPMSITTFTSYAPSSVRLPAAFVGDFSLNQGYGWQRPVVHFDAEHDPAGRALRIAGLDDRSVSGDVRARDAVPPPGQYWLPKGQVNMRSTNGDIDLYV